MRRLEEDRSAEQYGKLPAVWLLVVRHESRNASL